MACQARSLTCDDPEYKEPALDLLRRCIVILTDEEGNDALDANGKKQFALRQYTPDCASGSTSGIGGGI